ncbi:hypothetical protein AXK11_06390 [Cephaloticoccus primus]|uniref:Uncharacterized protein n=1 Tax=Cephaloticoccus primus TaxID=1548207 RepID=A0A139SLM6_9BACT|nr:hypothetical protein [Cephaloticoccus primus]KXU35463.1 hypothetical protein AXK11_06390 [Cephaloticoccus primus]
MTFTDTPSPRLPRLAALALGLFAINTAPLPVHAQGQPPPPAYSIATVAHPIDFRLLAARATINKRDYVLSDQHPPLVTPVGENLYRLELHLRRNSRKSWRGEEKVSVHFFYDGFALTFFGDRNRNERPDQREGRQEHLIRHKEEVVTEGNRSFVRPVELLIELGRGEVSSPSSLRSLQLHLIFPQ